MKRRAQIYAEAVNVGLKDIPREKVRFHTCYGINAGPRLYEASLAQIIEYVLSIKAGSYSFEGANPRHAHEWRVFEKVKLPPGKLIIPGVIDSTTNFVEHPELVAERIVNYARLVGRENVIAGTDCGFATAAEGSPVFPSIAWAKLAALAEGARIATTRLW